MVEYLTGHHVLVTLTLKGGTIRLNKMATLHRLGHLKTLDNAMMHTSCAKKQLDKGNEIL